jgi:class 3 adenylate cyclase
LDKFIGDGIFA